MASDRFIKNAARLGHPAVLSQITGTDCPCRLSYDGKHPTYSKQWHEDHPTIEDCKGSLLIDTDVTKTNVKVFITEIMLSERENALRTQVMEAIGTLKKDDLAITGTVDVDEMNFVNLESAKEDDTFFTIDGKKYFIKLVFPLRTKSLDGQLLYLRRIEES